MSSSKKGINIKESMLRRAGKLLDILLSDRTTGKNIIWATDFYEKFGKNFLPKNSITPALVTGKYRTIIQPRATKSFAEQRQRTREKAEVFTPLNIVDKINKEVDKLGVNQRFSKKNWQDYVRELRLEIACGEAPFIVSRYDPTAHTSELIKLDRRVGFLDQKLKVTSRHCQNKKEWISWAKVAFKASYGYEWQGDNVLLARENLLYSFIDYYEAKFKKPPVLKLLEEFAEIISWNIFQMDGLKYVVPMTCHSERKIIPGRLPLYKETANIIEKQECEGCEHNYPKKHNGKYVKIMDWNKNKVVMFIDIVFDNKIQLNNRN